MHDATEGGVIGGLFEIASASGTGMEIHEEAFVYPEEVRMVCEAFGIDPLAAIAEGSLLIHGKAGPFKGHSPQTKCQWHRGIRYRKVKRDREDKNNQAAGRDTRSLGIQTQDPFWPVFFGAL